MSFSVVQAASIEGSAGSSGADAPANPLVLPPVLARIVHALDLNRFRELGKLAKRGQESIARGAPPGCYFLASACRAAANEAVRCIRVRNCAR